MFGTYKQIILTTFTNVGSNQIQLIRKFLRPTNSILVISKNVPTFLPRPSSRKSSECALRVSMMKSSLTLRSSSEERSLNSRSSSPSSRRKLHSSSPRPPSTTSRDKSKPTKFPLKPELEPSHLSILPSPLDPLDLTHPKSTFSTPSTSPPRLSKVKLKSPKNSECAPLERRSRLPKLPS